VTVRWVISMRTRPVGDFDENAEVGPQLPHDPLRAEEGAGGGYAAGHGPDQDRIRHQQEEGGLPPVIQLQDVGEKLGRVGIAPMLQGGGRGDGEDGHGHGSGGQGPVLEGQGGVGQVGGGPGGGIG